MADLGATSRSAPLAVVILAAGKGTRMKSTLPKMLHEVAGRPLLEHVIRACEPLRPERTVVVVGHGAERIRERLADYPLRFAHQHEQLGSGHALLTARGELADFDGDVMVLNGDAPLLTSETLAALVAGHRRRCGPGMTLLTYTVADPTGLGRIVRAADGRLQGIVEERDADEATRAIREITPGFYLFDGRVFELAERLSNDNAQGEYYITKLPALYLEAGLEVGTVTGWDEAGLLVGVNDRLQLAEAERLLRARIGRRWMAAGVTLRAPSTTFIDDTVELSRDVVLEPGVILRGATHVGEGAIIGAYSVLDGVEVAPGERVAPLTVARAEG